jgi:hypothetical protein
MSSSSLPHVLFFITCILHVLFFITENLKAAPRSTLSDVSLRWRSAVHRPLVVLRAAVFQAVVAAHA